MSPPRTRWLLPLLLSTVVAAGAGGAVDARARFRLTANGRVIGFMLYENGRATPARKIR
jgi:hypothetical protein